MGASNFSHEATGTTAADAFRTAVEEARAEYGDRGYTGSIAEKTSFELMKTDSVNRLVYDLRHYAMLITDDPSWNTAEENAKLKETEAQYAPGFFRKVAKLHEDKWGPAIALQLDTNRFLFIGLASS